jgi:hypothetical protein
MKSIKIIAGSYGYRPEGAKSVTLITKQHPPVVVSDTEAERLIELGVAVIVENDIPLTRPGESRDMGERPEYSMKNKADELKALMDEFDLKYEDGITKQQMVDALDAFFDTPDDNEEEDEEDDEENVGQGAPDLSAQSSVVE